MITRGALVAANRPVAGMVYTALLCACGGAGQEYRSQACVEQALRRTDDLDMVAEARAQFEEQCRQGHGVACSALGVMYETGTGVARSPERAADFYARACRTGNERGCANFAIAQIEGIGVPKQTAMAARALESACEKRDGRACLYLARLLEVGDGATRDPALAARLFAIACDGEEAAACVAHAENDERAGNHASTEAYLTKACALGDKGACSRLDPDPYASTGVMRSSKPLIQVSETR